MDPISKSARLRNTSVIYYKVIKLLANQDKGYARSRASFSSSQPRQSSPIKIHSQLSKKKDASLPNSDTNVKTKKLNSYQLFVRSESKKDIYIGMNAKNRMQQISKKWKRSNK